jgi:translocation and assembly module TamB
LSSVVSQGNVEAKGDVALAGDYNTTATMDVRALPIGPLLADYASGSSPNLQGQTEIHAEINGPLKDPARMQVHVEVPVFNLAYQSMSIALVRPLRLDYRDGIATVQETELKGTGTDLKLQGVIPVKSSSTAFNLAANGTMDLSLIQGLTRGVKSSGRIDLQVNGRGDLKNPTIQGHVKVANAYFSSDASPVGVEDVNGQLNLSGRRLDVAQLSGRAGGGTVAVQGFLVYGSQSNFNLSVQANSVRLRYPEGLRSILNCNLQLNGSTAASTLSGRVLVDRLSFTQQFDLGSFAGQFVSRATTGSTSPAEQNMRLNVSVQSAQDLSLASSQVSMQGAANLNVVGTLANPVVLGRVSLTGGDIFFLGKRYEVQDGVIEFSNPVQTEPVVNLHITTTVEQYDITLNLVGPVDRLRTNYTSSPALPASDIINLLALGQTAEESATSTTSTSTSAESVVASGAASQVSSKIQRLAGISQLTIDPLASSNTTDPGSQVSIQQRVTGNILLTFSTDVTSTQATTVQLRYRTSRQTSVSVLRDQNGGYAVDFRIHKTF